MYVQSKEFDDLTSISPLGCSGALHCISALFLFIALAVMSYGADSGAANWDNTGVDSESNILNTIASRRHLIRPMSVLFVSLIFWNVYYTHLKT